MKNAYEECGWDILWTIGLAIAFWLLYISLP
jgi:hypothetical protein